jgi:hypothetical protein
MSESTSNGIQSAPDSQAGQPESTLDQFLTEPDPQADTVPHSGFWPRTSPGRPAASPLSLLARLAGVIALAFAVAAAFVLLSSHSHLSAAHTTAGVTHAPSTRRPVRVPVHKAAAAPVKVKATRHATRPGRRLSAPESRPVVVVRQVTQGSSASGSPAQPKAAPEAAPKPAPKATAPPTVEVGGDVSCLSGQSIEGVWVQATGHSGFAPWQGSSTSKWWWWLPKGESYSLHVGCGGTQASWGVALYTPVVTGSDTFVCIDVSSDAGYGTCYVN